MALKSNPDTFQMFAYAYGACGRCASVVMVNSSWTESHIVNLWRCSDGVIQKIYPPCDVQEFREIPRQVSNLCSIISLGQFRPEKDHPLQIRALAKVRDNIMDDDALSDDQKEEKWNKVSRV